MTCTCDQRSWPPRPHIAAGLDDLPRQLFTFADLKEEMLARAGLQPALDAWRGRSRSDFGVMLLELWAYVGELMSIYDKAIADESYVRTAKLRPSLRRLISLLGYQPRPAVASTAQLALIADGVKPLVIPAGTAFRSGAFGTEKPQVFELTSDATIHPALNQWPLATPPETTLSGSVSELLLDPASVRLAAGDTFVIELPSQVFVRKVASVTREVDGAGRRVARLTLDSAFDAGWSGVAVSSVSLRKATRKASLKSPSGVGGDPESYEVNTFIYYGYYAAAGPGFGGGHIFHPPRFSFVLDGIHRDIHAGERFLIENAGEQRYATVRTRYEDSFTLIDGGGQPTTTTTLEDQDGKTTGKVVVPGTTVYSTYTVVTIDDSLDDGDHRPAGSPAWSTITDATGFTLHYGLVTAGRVLGAAKRTLSATDPLRALGTRQPVNSTAETSQIILRDAEADAVAVDGSIALDTGVITLGSGETWSPPLATPVTGFGNVVTVVRGETVAYEVLGDGDAAQTHQSFKLKKKPLTYVAAPSTDSGVASTLRVWVDGLMWTEVPTLYGQDGNAQVYVVRQLDDGTSVVTFGDGIRGARPATGFSNIVASYRFGAGAAAPPAGSITQLAKPVTGLRSVVAPLPAGGGADAEAASSLATIAPRSALLLGRAISIDDMEAGALGVPGVVTARTDWAWDGLRQRPVVKVWVVGDVTSPASVSARLLALTEPNTPIQVVAATKKHVYLAIDLELDPKRVASDVLAAANSALTGDGGWLTPAHVGIDRPLYRSQLVERLMSITGVTGVRGLTWNRFPFNVFGKTPGQGAYFDFTVTVTGS